MLTTGIDGRGFRDWVLQRFSAVLIGSYAIFLIIYLLNAQPLYFAQWQALFQHPVMKIATLLVMLNILVHAWIGIWTVLTDYVKCQVLRLGLELLVGLGLMIYLAWTIDILWGVL